jgi:hypothetical protein
MKQFEILAVPRLPYFGTGRTPPARAPPVRATVGHIASPDRRTGPHAPPHSSPSHGDSRGPSPSTPSRPLKRAPRHHRAPFSSPSNFSPSWPRKRTPPSLLGLVSAPGDCTATALTIFASSCRHFPPHGELDPCAPFSLSWVVPHFPLLRTLLQDPPEDGVDHQSTATARSTFSASPTSGRLGECIRLSFCPAQPQLPTLSHDFPVGVLHLGRRRGRAGHTAPRLTG